MTCLRNHLSSFLLVIAMLLMSNVSFAGEREYLYKIGKEAYGKKDYVSALKNLYAYYVLNEVEINKHPDFKKTIDDSISTSEAILNEKISINNRTSNRSDSFWGKAEEANKNRLNAIRNADNKAIENK